MNNKMLLPIIQYFLLITWFIGCAFMGAAFFLVHNHVVDFSKLHLYHAGAPSIVLDEYGVEITRFQLDRRKPIALESIPLHLINAFIAAEDWQFFDHHGLSIRGIVRSVGVNVLKGRKAQGASTITQQLVRLLFFDTAKTYSRKIKEQIYTLLVEMQFTKEYILETYLNNIYFGAGIYGVEAATQRFWGKSVSDITLDEAATLAGIICAPNRYCPLMYPLSAQRRRDIVLRAMERRGCISAELSAQAQNVPIYTVALHDKKYGTHVVECLRQELEERVGKKTLYTEGLTIYTTLNLSMQQKAENCFVDHVAELRASKKIPFDGGLVTLDVSTGGIKAYVGGFDFTTSQFDRVQGAERQLGSIFKVILYAAAIASGKEFSDTAVDEPLTVMQGSKSWSPRNYTRDFKGCMTLAYALSRSNNIVAVKTLLEIGIAPVVELARKMHVKDHIPPYPALALGCVDTSLLKATAMFSVFAAQGVYHEPHIILKIKDKFGNVMWKRQESPGEVVIDSRVSGKVARVLQYSLDRYAKYFPEYTLDADIIAKTGTTNDSRTCWYIGASPTYATGVWIGCDDNRPLGKNVFPIHTAFPIWLASMSSWSHRYSSFVYNPLLQELCIDTKTGVVCHQSSGSSMNILV